jgi:hypothetical protein
MARPISTSYTDEEKAEVVAHILVNVACGRYVSRIFREDETTAQGISIPAESTFWLWLFKDDTDELSEKLARAREFGIEAKLDEALVVAETTAVGEIRTDKHINVGGVAVPVTEIRHEDMLGHRKLLIETTFKAAQMMKPKKYGPKIDFTSGGEPVQMDDTAIAVRAAALVQAALDRDEPE